MEEILHQLIGILSHYLQDFINPRWLFGISSINSIKRSFHPYLHIPSDEWIVGKPIRLGWGTTWVVFLSYDVVCCDRCGWVFLNVWMVSLLMMFKFKILNTLEFLIVQCQCSWVHYYRLPILIRWGEVGEIGRAQFGLGVETWREKVIVCSLNMPCLTW